MAQKILPPHPWTIAFGYKARVATTAMVLFAVSAAILFTVLYWQGGHLRRLFAEQSAWNDDDAREVDAEYSGSRRTSRRSLTNSYKLSVTFDVEDQPVTKQLEFETFGRLDDTATPIVRYDPTNPDRFALNVAVEKNLGRWGAALLYGGIFAFVGIAIGVGARRKLRHFLYTRSLETRGVELHCKLLSIEEERDGNGRATNNSIYHVQIPGKRDDPRSPYATSQRGAFVLPDRQAPLEVGEGGDQLIVLVPVGATYVPETLVGLRHDYYPLQLTTAQKRAAEAKRAASA